VNAETIARCTSARIDRAQAFATGLSTAMALYEINTPVRQAMFLANIGHETGGLKWLSEIWGPTPAQARYEGRKDLGNTQPGDGRRFAGHGMLQTTGRYNHAAVRDRLRKRFPEMAVPDFEAEPMQLTKPEWASLAAADYIAMKNGNRFADANDFEGYVKMINGGLNGIKDRHDRFELASKALALV